MYLCVKLSDGVPVKKVIILVGLSLIFPLATWAQYSNSWINFDQQYFKIPVGKDGIYRLTYTNLQSAGFPLASVDPRFIQLFHRGTEQAIVVQGEDDASFDAPDYIEFYGQKNDGTLDSLLYHPSSLQPHPYYNLYSDTAAYFLTWSQSPTRGKRMTSFFQNNVTNIPKETFHNDQELSVFAAQYSGGNTQSNGEIQSTAFDEGEGWTDTYICIGNSGCTGFKDYQILNLTSTIPSGGNPRLDLLIVGRDEINHHAEVHVGPDASSERLLATQNFVNFQVQHISSDLNWSDFGPDGTMVVTVKTPYIDSTRDIISVSYIKITFPQGYDVTGQVKKVFHLNPNPTGSSYIELSSAASGSRLWDITDVNNLITIGTSRSGSLLTAVVPNTTTSRTLLMSSEINTPSILPITFQQIDPASATYIILTHPKLLGAAQDFASYRSSTAGGGYSTLTLTIDQVYDQFNYGEISCLGIFQLMKFMVEKGSPAYFFIIGKGIDITYGFHRKTSFLPTDLRDLVPTAGLPASDMAFSAQLKGSGYVPNVATGRISASTPAEVEGYLSKVKEMEATPLNALWRKDGLHLSGGILPDELIDFRSYMDGFAAIAEGEYWGANITTIAKHDPTAVKQINISDEVNAGVNLITFFGHSSPGTIDIDIGDASDPKLGYNNPGKYPVFLINGCNAGNFFANGTSFGEDWMLTSEKGARGFIAHSFFGFIQNLKAYSNLFYTVAFADSIFIQRGLGDVQKEVANRYISNYGTDISNITQVQQMVLLGDPAVRLFGTTLPDYETDDSSISIASLDGRPVTSASDSFNINVIVRNFGATNQKPLAVKLVRTYSDNFTSTYTQNFKPVLIQDTLVFKIFKERTEGSGSNQFTVTLDYLNAIAELNELNNTGTAHFVIASGGTQNLFPVPYAIVNQPTINFIFQSVNALAGQRSFQFQLDTTSLFSSAMLTQQKVSGNVLAQLSITLTGSDSTVYYWRTKFDQPLPNESTQWFTSSFTLIRTSPTGWAQRKFSQLLENGFSGIVPDSASRSLRFVETSSDLQVTTYGFANPATNLDVSVKIDHAEFNLATEGDPCRNNTLNFIAFDKTTLVPYPALDLGFQSVNTCGREPEVINSFTLAEMDNASGQDVLDEVDNIHTSDSVLIFSIGNIAHSQWTSAVKSKLELLGLDDAQLSTFQDGDPLVILGRKGAAPGTAKVYLSPVAPASDQELVVSKTITGSYTSGNMNSVVIGPALKWKQLVAKARSIQTSDVYSFVLSGVTADGSETVLQSNINGTTDLSSIDANVYPWLRLELQTDDDVNLSPVQLAQWLVLYDPVAEGVLLFSGPVTQQHLGEGQIWKGSYKFVNISAQAFTDSLTVDFEVLTAGLKKEANTFKISAPTPGDSTLFSVSTTTTGKVGLNDVDVFVNRKILPEQYYNNNEIDLTEYLNVQHDSIAPVLEVTVDGRFLENNDFVSPTPVIRIQVRDDNKYFLKTDTTGISIVLTYPCSNTDCPGQPVYFSRQDVTWSPATANSDFTVIFTPHNLADGTYSLFAEAADESGNKSGSTPYEIGFQVKSEATFSFSSAYPNPSSSIFYFNFLLTGNEIPESFSMNIYGFDGRLLQEYGLNDIGNFHIGSNQLIWDPSSNLASLLPSGFYLYRIALTIQGKDYHETGKLVLTR
jgi:hypothetical protein